MIWEVEHFRIPQDIFLNSEYFFFTLSHGKNVKQLKAFISILLNLILYPPLLSSMTSLCIQSEKNPPMSTFKI